PLSARPCNENGHGFRTTCKSRPHGKAPPPDGEPLPGRRNAEERPAACWPSTAGLDHLVLRPGRERAIAPVVKGVTLVDCACPRHGTPPHWREYQHRASRSPSCLIHSPR